jgi:hypothetical protein
VPEDGFENDVCEHCSIDSLYTWLYDRFDDMIDMDNETDRPAVKHIKDYINDYLTNNNYSYDQRRFFSVKKFINSILDDKWMIVYYNERTNAFEICGMETHTSGSYGNMYESCVMNDATGDCEMNGDNESFYVVSIQIEY